MGKIIDYLRLVKFSHTIFAMPFALMSFVYAVKSSPEDLSNSNPYWWAVLLVQVVLCMIFVRKGQGVVYSTLEIIGIIFNFIVIASFAFKVSVFGVVSPFSQRETACLVTNIFSASAS